VRKRRTKLTGPASGEPQAVELALRLSGKRVTAPRVAVYRALVNLGGHRSADEVREAVARSGEAHARASVYSALRTLAQAGVVMVADAGPGRTLYEAGVSWHHHAVCRVCGSVSDVPCVVGAKPCLRPSVEWGDVDEAQVIFRGVCERCRTNPTRHERDKRERRERDASTHHQPKKDLDESSS
jgi:Fe2+ or Zn2+ uptake regulation protein